jgi:hypothetical protein
VPRLLTCPSSGDLADMGDYRETSLMKNCPSP